MIDAPSLGQPLFSGAIWMFAVRWVMRLLSVISIAVLARLLEKDDFGLVALASAVIALPAVLTDLGVEQAIIAERAPARRCLQYGLDDSSDSAGDRRGRTLPRRSVDRQLLRRPAHPPMIQVLSTMVLLKGMENIWTVSFRKELNFRRDFIYEAICKVLAVTLTIALAVFAPILLGTRLRSSSRGGRAGGHQHVHLA